MKKIKKTYLEFLKRISEGENCLLSLWTFLIDYDEKLSIEQKKILLGKLISTTKEKYEEFDLNKGNILFYGRYIVKLFDEVITNEMTDDLNWIFASLLGTSVSDDYGCFIADLFEKNSYISLEKVVDIIISENLIESAKELIIICKYSRELKNLDLVYYRLIEMLPKWKIKELFKRGVLKSYDYSNFSDKCDQVIFELNYLNFKSTKINYRANQFKKTKKSRY